MADSTNDSDSDLEYSDCLEAAELGNDLKVDELADVKNDEKSCNKNDSNEKFFDIHSSLGDEKAEADDEDEVDPLKMRQEEDDKLTEEEKEIRRKSAKALKDEGNVLYLAGENSSAIAKYSEGLELCPLCFKEDRAILFANRAAVHIKTDEKEAAIQDCSRAIDLKPDYVKALLRRGQALEDVDKPHEALKDFEKALEVDPGLKEARAACMRLPDKIREKDEKLKEEMLENLKKLGNMVLRPFGLSTNNFNVIQDPSTGGYSVNFQK